MPEQLRILKRSRGRQTCDFTEKPPLLRERAQGLEQALLKNLLPKVQQ